LLRFDVALEHVQTYPRFDAQIATADLARLKLTIRWQRLPTKEFLNHFVKCGNIAGSAAYRRLIKHTSLADFCSTDYFGIIDSFRPISNDPI